jgi:hypothetical protein
LPLVAVIPGAGLNGTAAIEDKEVRMLG